MVKSKPTCILITGGRDYGDIGAVFDCLTYLDSETERMVVVHGDAPGADSLAFEVCKEVGIEQVRVPAAWEKFKRGAGPIRNSLMLELIDIDMVLAFPGGVGTKNMKEQARSAGIPVIESDVLITGIRGGGSQK